MRKRDRNRIEERVTYLRLLLNLKSLFVARQPRAKLRLCIIDGAFGENTIVAGDWQPARVPRIDVYLSPALSLEGLMTWTDGLIQGALVAPWN